MAKVSIIIPSYNHDRFLKQRLYTIVNQTYTDWELIIIDDCSTDGSIDVLKRFVNENSGKIKHFIINETNSGSGYHSWKKGIELANTEYIWIAETDDYSDSNFLLESVMALDENKSCSLCFCASNYVDQSNNFLHDTSNRTEDLEVKEDLFKIFDSSILINKMPFEPYVTNGSGVVFRNPDGRLPNEIFQQKQSSDIFLWTYLVHGKEFAFLNKPLNYFRRHSDSTTTKFTNLQSDEIYFERANYLNYFEYQEKNIQFIKHYIKYFVNANKSAIFNITPILKIENVFGLRIKYIGFLFTFYTKKIINKIFR